MRSGTEGSVVRGWGRIARLGVTMVVAVAAFCLLAGPSCPLMGGGSSETPKVSKKVAKADVETNDESNAEEESAPAPARVAPARQETGKQQAMEVGKLVLTDASGNERARLEIFPDGAVGLTFLDNRGKERAYYGLEADGVPMYVLRDDYGTDRARMFLSDTGAPMLDLMGKRGTVKANVTLSDGEDPTISLFNDNGTVKTSYYLQKNGDPILSYLDDNGKEVTVIPLAEGKTTVTTTPRPTTRPTVVVNPTPPSKPHEASSVGETVVVIVKGKKKLYHLPSCPNLLAFSKEEKRHLLLKDVAAKGFMPCPVCRPPRYVP